MQKPGIKAYAVLGLVIALSLTVAIWRDVTSLATREFGDYTLERPERDDYPAFPEFEPATPLDRPWADALPLPDEITRRQKCLAEALYFEARGESIRGQIAVAEVILNRAEHPDFPDRVCDVVYQGRENENGCQFSYACDDLPEDFNETDAYERSLRIAAFMLRHGAWDFTRGAIYYHTHSVSPGWAAKMKVLADIGNHLFLGPKEK